MPRGPVLLLDTMWAGAGGPPNPNLLARDAYIDMMQTAQNVADRYELTREEIDAFALRSHQHAAARPRLRAARRGDPPGRDRGHPQAGGAHLRARRVDPRRHDGGEARRAAAAAEHDPDDGRQLLAAERRRQRRRPRQRGGGRGARRRAAGARRRVGDPRARPADHGDRAGVRDPEGARARGPAPRSRSTSGRSTRPTRRSPSRSCASCRASSTASRSPTSASTRTAARSPSATRSAHRAPATCSRSRPSCACARPATASSACASGRGREWRSCSRTRGTNEPATRTSKVERMTRRRRARCPRSETAIMSPAPTRPG